MATAASALPIPFIDTLNQQSLVYHQPKNSETCYLIAQFDYPLDEEAVPLTNKFQRNRPAFWPRVAKFGCKSAHYPRKINCVLTQGEQKALRKEGAASLEGLAGGIRSNRGLVSRIRTIDPGHPR
jgi:hypothetical protein